MPPDVSIIVPVHGQWHWVGRCLDARATSAHSSALAARQGPHGRHWLPATPWHIGPQTLPPRVPERRPA